MKASRNLSSMAISSSRGVVTSSSEDEREEAEVASVLREECEETVAWAGWEGGRCAMMVPNNDDDRCRGRICICSC